MVFNSNSFQNAIARMRQNQQQGQVQNRANSGGGLNRVSNISTAGPPRGSAGSGFTAFPGAASGQSGGPGNYRNNPNFIGDPGFSRGMPSGAPTGPFSTGQPRVRTSYTASGGGQYGLAGGAPINMQNMIAQGAINPEHRTVARPGTFRPDDHALAFAQLQRERFPDRYGGVGGGTGLDNVAAMIAQRNQLPRQSGGVGGGVRPGGDMGGNTPQARVQALLNQVNGNQQGGQQGSQQQGNQQQGGGQQGSSGVPESYQDLPQTWIQSSMNPHLQGRDLPARLAMLNQRGAPLPPGAVDALTSQSPGVSNLGRAITGRGIGFGMPSLQTLNRMDPGEREFLLEGLLQGVGGIPMEDALSYLMGSTRGLGNAVAAR